MQDENRAPSESAQDGPEIAEDGEFLDFYEFEDESYLGDPQTVQSEREADVEDSPEG